MLLSTRVQARRRRTRITKKKKKKEQKKKKSFATADLVSSDCWSLSSDHS